MAQEHKRRMMDTELDMYIIDQNRVLPAMTDPNTRWDSVSRKDDLFFYNFSVDEAKNPLTELRVSCKECEETG